MMVTLAFLQPVLTSTMASKDAQDAGKRDSEATDSSESKRARTEEDFFALVDRRPVSMKEFQGSVLCIVNVASE